MSNILSRYVPVFLIGGFIYSSIEVLFRGHSHWTMTITGGICFLFLYFIAVFLEGPLWKKSILGAFIITIIEFIVGIIVNKALGWEVWDYSAWPLNIMGQICLPFSLIWVVLSAAGIMLSQYIYKIQMNYLFRHTK